MSSLSTREQLVKKLLTNRKFRDAYVYEHVRNGVPFQLRAMRKDRDWSQAELAEAASTSRTVITRIEDPNYGKLTLNTLLQMASAFDVALMVKFVPFTRLVREYEDVSSDALVAKEISQERQQLMRWASAGVRTSAASNTADANQLQLAFAQTIPVEATTTETNELEPQVSGQIVSLDDYKRTVRRPLNQRKISKQRVPMRLRRSGTR